MTARMPADYPLHHGMSRLNATFRSPKLLPDLHLQIVAMKRRLSGRAVAVLFGDGSTDSADHDGSMA